MCLTTIDKNYNNAQFGVGYKMFEVSESKEEKTLYSPSHIAPQTQYPINKWLRDKNEYDIYATFKKEYSVYETGFHIFVNKQDALDSVKSYLNSNPRHKYEVRLVFYRKIVSIGQNETLGGNHGLTIVAKEINVQEGS